MIQKPEEVTLEQKIKNCRQVVIQNMERTLQHKMVFKYLGDKKIDNEIKTFSVNSKDGIIKIEFYDAVKALAFYDNSNFKDKILIRPLNIYFSLQLNDSEMKKYFIEGVTEENQRAIFDATRKLGICKIYTNYQNSATSRKPKPKGVLSFIRKDELSPEQFKQLEEDLRKEQVKISPYIAEKGLRCTINVFNFFTGDLAKEDSDIMKDAEQEIRNITKSIVKDAFTSVSINVKRREDKTYVTALLEFAENDQAMDNFELLRVAFLNRGQTKAVISFHNHDNNSYFSLFTSGLQKPEEVSDKQFEQNLLEAYRKVNKHVIQVNVFPVTFNKTYIGRIFLRSEQEGKNFIVNYVSKREDLVKLYKDASRINFNINVDSKTLKKIKQAERKATDIARGIKNSEEAQKKSRKQNPAAINQIPLNMPMGMGMPFGPNMGPIGMIPQQPQMIGQQKMPVMNMGSVPPMGMMNMQPQQNLGEANPKVKLQQFIRDKDKFLKMQPHTARRLLMPSLKYVIEQCNVQKSEVPIICERLLKEQVLEIYKYLENQEELKKKISK